MNTSRLNLALLTGDEKFLNALVKKFWRLVELEDVQALGVPKNKVPICWDWVVIRSKVPRARARYTRWGMSATGLSLAPPFCFAYLLSFAPIFSSSAIP